MFYGHTRTGTEPVRHGNQSWIDTGAYRTGILTMVDADTWIAGSRTTRSEDPTRIDIT